jgi:hypothetical protein
MKKIGLLVALILVLLFSALAGTQFVDLTLANPNPAAPFSYLDTPDRSPPWSFALGELMLLEFL